MKAINITPEVWKIEKKAHAEGSKVAGYTLEQALNKEQIQIFCDEGRTTFWFENRNAAKYAVDHLISQISASTKMKYRDLKPKIVGSVAKAVAKRKKMAELEEEQAEEQNRPELRNKAATVNLREFVKQYMSDFHVPDNLKKEELDEDERAEFFKLVGKSLSAGITAVLNKIYGGKKPEYRTKAKMNAEERKTYDLQNREEFDWFLNNLIWLGDPSDKYLKEHRKFTVANYMKVSADLRSLVSNSLYQERSKF